MAQTVQRRMYGDWSLDAQYPHKEPALQHVPTRQRQEAIWGLPGGQVSRIWLNPGSVKNPKWKVIEAGTRN